MLKKYIYIFLISMIPLIELRGAVPVSQVMGLPIVPSFIVCIIANMLPVPIIYLFARKVLIWGADKPIIGRFFSFCLEKGEKGGKKLQAKAGRGLFVALLLFVGIPLPGTGAWTGTLAASILDMDFKSTVAAVMLGVLLAGMIMMIVSLAGVTIEFMGSFLRPLLNSTNPTTSEIIVTAITITKTTTLLPGSGKNPESVPQRLKSR